MAGFALGRVEAEKKSLHAAEQDTAEAQQRRQAWWDEVRRFAAEQLVFLDESGATTKMTRRHGRAPGNQRVGEAVPQGHWRTVTMLAALTVGGLQAPMIIESPSDGDIFLAYLEQMLCPSLHPGQIVILDNAGRSQRGWRRAAGGKHGARLLYLPPYSPDFNRIEQAWSKIKQLLRAAKARTLDALETAIADALAAVTVDSARAWFVHCGYGLR